MTTGLQIAGDIQLSSQVSEFLNRSLKLLIGGKWVEAASGQTFPVFNPATDNTIAQVAAGDREDIDRAVKAARYAFENGPWSKITVSERGRLIWKLADLLEGHLEEFAELESLDNGKPISVARVADVPLAVDMFRYMAGWATKIEGNTIPVSVPYAPDTQYFAYTLREPIGVVGQIIPWNFTDGSMETSACTSCWLHYRLETSRTNSPISHSPRRTDLRSRIPRWRYQHCDRLW
jgi:phenylacetaldehyde dehydrogenase